MESKDFDMSSFYPEDDFIIQLANSYMAFNGEPIGQDTLFKILDWIGNQRLSVFLIDMVGTEDLGMEWDDKNCEPLFFLTEKGRKRVREQDQESVDDLLNSVLGNNNEGE